MDLFKSPKFLLFGQCAFLYAWLVNLQKTDSYYSVYLLIAMLSLYAMQCNHKFKVEIICRNQVVTELFAAFFSAAMLLANYSLFSPWSALLNLFNAFCTFIGGWLAFTHILLWMLHVFPLKVNAEGRNHNKAIFVISFAVITVVYLIYLLFCAFPGLLSTDSFSTVMQILEKEYNNILPYYHTKLIAVFFAPVYKLTGDINLAIAVFHVAQIVFLSASFAYVVMTLYQIGVPYVIIALVLGGYALLPYHVIYSVSLWKDVLFGAAAALTVTSLYRIIKKIGNTNWNEIVLLTGSAGLCLWRTNGWYAFAVTAIVMFILLRKKYKRLLCIMAGVLVVCWILINPVLVILQVPGTDFLEALGIPFQQIARVVATGCPLTAEEEQMLSEVFILDLVAEKYDPNIVDPIKFETLRYFKRDYLKENIGEYALLWLKLGLKYPGVYLQAWIETTKGYWNGGYEYWIYIKSMGDNTLGFVQTGGNNPIASIMYALHRYMEKPAILQPIYSIGLQIWMLMISCFLCIKQQREEFVITIPLLVIIAGLWIGTPVFAEFRYAYPVFTSMPLIACMSIYDRKLN